MGCTVLLARCPTPIAADDLDRAFESLARIKSRISPTRVTEVNRRCHVSTDIFPLRIFHYIPKRFFNLCLGQRVSRDLDITGVIVKWQTSLYQALI